MSDKLWAVTGAPGWLGTRLVEKLREAGYPVRCLVKPGQDTSELTRFGAQIVYGDVTDAATLKGAFKDVDLLFHLVGIIHPRSIRDFWMINALGTRNVITEAAEAGVRRFIYMSSNSAQGVCQDRAIPMKEGDPCDPQKTYGKTKYEAERIVRAFHEAGKIQATIIRACMFYGIRQPDRQRTMMKMIRKGNTVIFGDGSNLRSLSGIDNLTDGLILAAQKDIAIGKTYWMADPEPYSFLQAYQASAEAMGVKLSLLHLPTFFSSIAEIMDDILQAAGLYSTYVHVAGEMVKNITCDISLAQKELGFDPRQTLAEGMKAAYQWSVDHGEL